MAEGEDKDEQDEIDGIKINKEKEILDASKCLEIRFYNHNANRFENFVELNKIIH